MWKKHKNGIEIGTKGPERGIIIRDKEYQNEARIILERNCEHAKYTITLEINGLLICTSIASNYLKAIQVHRMMKADIKYVFKTTFEIS